jgi:hypothetical protein
MVFAFEKLIVYTKARERLEETSRMLSGQINGLEHRDK